jgi:hypothetical protein
VDYLVLAVIAGLAAVERKGFLQAMLARPVTLSQRIDLALTWDATPVSMKTFGADDLTSGTPPVHSSDHLGFVITIQP